MPTSSSERTTTVVRPRLRRSAQSLIRSVTLSALVLSFTAATARAAELLYVYAPDCPACRKFDAEAGRIYPKTPEAQQMPMRRILLADWQAGRVADRACAAAPVVGTPTFLLLQDCTELERITGYSTDEGFWMGLSRMSRLLERQQQGAH